MEAMQNYVVVYYEDQPFSQGYQPVSYAEFDDRIAAYRYWYDLLTETYPREARYGHYARDFEDFTVGRVVLKRTLLPQPDRLKT